MKSFIIASILLSIFILGCPQQPIAPPQPTPTSGSEFCDLADWHLASFCKSDPKANSYCCQVDAPTKLGESYTNFCIKKQAQGINLNPQCVASVTSCDQIDKCTNS